VTMKLRVSPRLVTNVLLILPLVGCSAGRTSTPTDTNSPSSFAIGGSVGGLLPGKSMVLQNNGSQSTTVIGNATFTFAASMPSGSPYKVTALMQPVGQTCAVSNGSGTVAAANIGNVAVVCSINSYHIDVKVTGLTGTGLVL